MISQVELSLTQDVLKRPIGGKHARYFSPKGNASQRLAEKQA
jgi:hypothetical protein